RPLRPGEPDQHGPRRVADAMARLLRPEGHGILLRKLCRAHVLLHDAIGLRPKLQGYHQASGPRRRQLGRPLRRHEGQVLRCSAFQARRWIL
ncbi:hypothetical protein LTR40_014981, partial [Exophiala xenobiotica]